MVFALFMKEMAAQTLPYPSLSCLVFYLLLHPVSVQYFRQMASPQVGDTSTKRHLNSLQIKRLNAKHEDFMLCQRGWANVRNV